MICSTHENFLKRAPIFYSNLFLPDIKDHGNSFAFSEKRMGNLKSIELIPIDCATKTINLVLHTKKVRHI